MANLLLEVDHNIIKLSSLAHLTCPDTIQEERETSWVENFGRRNIELKLKQCVLIMEVSLMKSSAEQNL